MQIVIGIATTGDRPKELENTLKSLEEQTVKANHIHVWDNSKNTDYTDNGKFEPLQHYDEPVYFFSMDDDILFPEDYIEKTIKEIDRWKCIVTYHGRILRGKGLNYYRGHTALACKHSFLQTKPIDVAGTGVTAFSTLYFNPSEIYKAEDKWMSDLVFSLEAAKQGKRIMHIGHYANWIIPQINTTETIWDRFNEDCERQNELADEIWLIKN